VRESYPQNYVTAAAMLFRINMGNWRRNGEAVTDGEHRDFVWNFSNLLRKPACRFESIAGHAI
jgi:hypothetical protein